MKYFFLFMFASMAFKPIYSLAAWPEQVLDIVAEYENNYNDPFISTAKIKCNETPPKYKRMEITTEDYYYKSSQLSKHNLRLKIGFQDHKAPLGVVLPGAFNNLDSKQPRALSNKFAELGYHFLTFPNPIGTEFIKTGANFTPLNIFKEAKLYYNALRNVYPYIRAMRGVTEIHLLGVSYGGVLNAIISALDAEHPYPIGIKSSTIISTAFDLRDTFRKIDQLIVDSSFPVTRTMLNDLFKLMKLCKVDNMDDISNEQIEISKSIIAKISFQYELYSSIKAYISTLPDSKSFISKITGDITFEKYFKELGLSSERSLSQYGKTLYWVERAKRAGTPDFRFLSSNDDFLNDYDTWPAGTNDFIILPTGGHYGVSATPWFNKMLDLNYQLD